MPFRIFPQHLLPFVPVLPLQRVNLIFRHPCAEHVRFLVDGSQSPKLRFDQHQHIFFRLGLDLNDSFLPKLRPLQFPRLTMALVLLDASQNLDPFSSVRLFPHVTMPIMARLVHLAKINHVASYDGVVLLRSRIRCIFRIQKSTLFLDFCGHV